MEVILWNRYNTKQYKTVIKKSCYSNTNINGETQTFTNMLNNKYHVIDI
jgi:hypothetical protein